MIHIIWVLWYDSWNELWWRKIRFQCSKISWWLLFSIWKISIGSFESSLPVRHGTSGVFSGIGGASGFDCWFLSRFIHWFENILSFCVTIVIRCETMAFRVFELYADWVVKWPIRKKHGHKIRQEVKIWSAWKHALDKPSFCKNCILNRPAFSGFHRSHPDNFTDVWINKIVHCRD